MFKVGDIVKLKKGLVIGGHGPGVTGEMALLSHSQALLLVEDLDGPYIYASEVGNPCNAWSYDPESLEWPHVIFEEEVWSL